MASGGETGYWPGFVDALSNMVMTLIIIIVLLNVALVYFFYKANKNTSQAVYTAVEAAQKTNVETIEALQKENQRLNEELKQMQDKAEAAVAEQSAPSSAGKTVAEHDPKKDIVPSKQAEKKLNEQALAQESQSVSSSREIKQAPKADPAQMSQQTNQASDNKKDQVAGQKELADQVETQSVPLSKQAENQGLIDDGQLENSYNNKKQRTAELNKNSLSTQGSNELVVVYEDDNVEFSPSTLIALNKELGVLISKNKSIKIEIEVEIFENKGYSFSRRLAYYRASSIRNFVLTKGADPSRVVTKLVSGTAAGEFPRAVIRISP